MDKEIVREFIDLKIQAKNIAARIDEIKGDLLADMKTDGIDKLPTNLGNLIIKKVPVWTYPQEIKDFEAKLEASKEEAKANGTATATEREQIEFRETKAVDSITA